MPFHLDVTITVRHGYLFPFVTAYVEKHVGNPLQHPFQHALKPFQFSECPIIRRWAYIFDPIISYPDIFYIEFFVRLS